MSLQSKFTDQLLLFSISTFLMESTFGLLIDYKENIELIQQRAGYDIKLQCNLKGLVNENKLADVKIQWYFKQCNQNSGTPNYCHDFHDADWTQLPCEEHFCKPDLLLHNVTEKYSGLYKCTVFPYYLTAEHAFDIKLVRTYQLDVKNNTVAIPEFFDSFPLNKTARMGTQVVFQCRVHSEFHPTYVKWFKRIREIDSGGMEHTNDNGNFNAHIVKYNGRTYELLSTAREKFISDEIYLSKLILNGVRLQDEGYYACVAISYRGHRIREAYLQVFPNDDAEYATDYDTATEGYTDPREFWLLFLMPLGLAMLPITVWLFYIMYKRYRINADAKIVSRDQQYSEEDHYMLRT